MSFFHKNSTARKKTKRLSYIVIVDLNDTLKTNYILIFDVLEEFLFIIHKRQHSFQSISKNLLKKENLLFSKNIKL